MNFNFPQPQQKNQQEVQKLLDKIANYLTPYNEGLYRPKEFDKLYFNEVKQILKEKGWDIKVDWRGQAGDAELYWKIKAI